MYRIKSLIAFLKLCVTNTSEVLKNLYNFTEETSCKNIVVNKHGLKDGIPVVDLLEIFPGFKEEISNYSFLEGTSFVTDLAVLKMIVRKFDNADYIEFGTWRGESISNVADVTTKCTSISFSEEEMRNVNTPESAIKVSQFFSRNNPNITAIKHDTQTFDFTSLKKKFDVVFVDADHKYPGVKKDTQSAFELLKDEKSIIVWHDAGRGMETNNWQVLAGMLDGAPKDAIKNIYRISNTICAIYTKENFKIIKPEKYVPNKVFSLSISAKKIN